MCYKGLAIANRDLFYVAGHYWSPKPWPERDSDNEVYVGAVWWPPLAGETERTNFGKLMKQTVENRWNVVRET